MKSRNFSIPSNRVSDSSCSFLFCITNLITIFAAYLCMYMRMTMNVPWFSLNLTNIHSNIKNRDDNDNKGIKVVLRTMIRD